MTMTYPSPSRQMSLRASGSRDGGTKGMGQAWCAVLTLSGAFRRNDCSSAAAGAGGCPLPYRWISGLLQACKM